MGSLPKSVASYYKQVPVTHRSTILEMRERILAIVPGAQEVIKYGMPTFQMEGRDICGIMAHKHHIGFYPYSGAILNKFPELEGRYLLTRGALHVPVGKPLPRYVLKKLIGARLQIEK